jgi:hypothetical protein
MIADEFGEIVGGTRRIRNRTRIFGNAGPEGASLNAEIASSPRT